ncbi:MAG TPA: M48 family metallopeptidase [Candidatus Pullilachnospira stercoravium]|uniref:M48 family metallopeptidase n=1 Tax=Candidatus Pullilachnospira stercoravium TaxID=2840913 RepID=A0A9D1NVD9_9FIRM|nr:M48 family metallopeptidase [Candidatus Pullilachnospira stercoravium]
MCRGGRRKPLRTVRKKEDPQRKQNRELARQRITRRVEYFAPLVGVTYNRIFIKEQKTRWGSCSSLGNLNFNWKLILLNEELLDYVVVHELAHRKQMNHSPTFWAEVERVLPDYRERRRRLKECRV